MNIQRILFHIPIYFLFTIIVFGQSTDNLSQFNKLIDKSISEIFQNSTKNSDGYAIDSPDNLKILANRAELNFAKYGLTVQTDSSNYNLMVKYNLDFAGIKYNDLYRDGLFGDYYLEREVTLRGYYIKGNSNSALTNEFELSEVDTVEYEFLSSYENPSLPFTQGVSPAEPFLKGIIEPVIAIGTVVITLLLFFTVRS